MQTKKKGGGRSTSKEYTGTRVSRSQKRCNENTQTQEKKVSELITSSVRRLRSSGSLHKKDVIPVVAKGSNRRHALVRDETDDACLNNDAISNASFDYKAEEDTGNQTIFSPSFHLTRSAEGGPMKGVDSITHCQSDLEIYRHDGGQQLQADTMNGHISHYSEYISLEEKLYDSNKATSMDRVCSSYMEIEEDISSKNSDASYSDMIINPDSDALNPQCSMELDGSRLSSEVSAIYFAMKNSKLECVDEHGQDTIAADVCAQDEDYEEYDDFDPYLFIKNLPDLASVVPTFRPMLLPKQTRSCPSTSLVLDLDETLVHSTLEPCDDADFTFPVNFNLQEHTVYVRCRPHLKEFMEKVSNMFEIIIFTASQSIYAEQLLNVLDPKRKVFRHRVYRDSCVYVEGNYLKDLSVLGRDLARVIIIDNSPQAFGFQVDNGIPIESWFDDRSDQELLQLLPFLESLAGVDDVRPLIAKKYSLREKIAAAVYPPLNSRRVDPF